MKNKLNNKIANAALITLALATVSFNASAIDLTAYQTEIETGFAALLALVGVIVTGKIGLAIAGMVGRKASGQIK